jgi:NAD(P)-dependent dehydrogenase (short-subunit alcohol dehydrogenase family)
LRTPTGKRNYVKHVADDNTARRSGTIEDVASGALFAMINTFMTGATLKIDGGEPLV